MKMQNGRTARRLGRSMLVCALVMSASAVASAAPPAKLPPPPPPPAAAPAAAPAPAPAPVPAPEPAPAPVPEPAPPPPPEAAPMPMYSAQSTAAQKQPRVPTNWGVDPAYSDANLPVLPRRLEYEEGDIILPGYELKSKPTKSLLTGGLVTFFVPYGLSAIFGAALLAEGGDRESAEFGPLVLPVIGPFITLGQNDDTSPDRYYSFFMLANGFTQATGAAMIAAAILVPTQYLEFTDRIPGKPEVSLGPASASVKLSF